MKIKDLQEMYSKKGMTYSDIYNNSAYKDLYDSKGRVSNNWDKSEIEKYFKEYINGDAEEIEDIPEEIDPNIDLIKFYGKLLVEKLTRMPNIGKMTIDGDFTPKRIGETDVYEIDIDITHNFDKMSADHIIETMKEIKQIEDCNNNVSVSIDSIIMVKIKIDYIDIKDLESAKGAVTKFKL